MSPHIVGGGLVCALGTHPGTALTAIAADLSRLEPFHDPRVQSRPIIVGRVRGPRDPDPDRHVMALLLGAVGHAAPSRPLTAEDEIAVVVGWPDPERPGAPPRPRVAELADLIGTRLGCPVDPERVRCLTGETSGARALAAGVQMLETDDLDTCMVVAADSWLTTEALAWLADRCLLRRRPLAEGMAPAEAGAALWLVRSSRPTAGLRLIGMGSTAGTSATSLSAGQALRHALLEANTELQCIDHRVVDTGADAWGGLKCSLAMSRVSRVPWEGCTWVPADAVGHVGAAAGLMSVLVAHHVLTRYGEGGTALCITSAPDQGHVVTILCAARGADASQEEPIPWAL